jgi:glycine cleavage system H protein
MELSMNVPTNLLYTEEHEWVLVDSDTILMGLTDFAQGELGDIVDVELVDEGLEFERGDSLGTIDAVKATSDIYAPVSGIIVEVNDEVASSPDLINEDPYGRGWLYRIKVTDQTDLDDHMSADGYEKHIS